MYLEITKDELRQTLSVLSRPDRFVWFKAQPSALQQDIALLIRTESIAAASSRIKAIENCQTMLLMKPKSIEKEKEKARIKAAKAKEKEKEKEKARIAKSIEKEKEKARKHKDTTGMIRHLTIVGMILRMVTPKGEAVRLAIETEFGSLVVKFPRSDARHITLFVEENEDGEESIVAHSLNSSFSGCRDTINVKKYTHPIAVPHVYDLVIQYNHEQTLSA